MSESRCFRIAGPEVAEVLEVLARLGTARPAPRPWAPASVGHDAGMQFHVMNRSQAQLGDKSVRVRDEAVNLSLEHRDPCEDEVTFGRVPDRTRLVNVQKVHGALRGCRLENTAGEGTWPPQTVGSTAFPTVIRLLYISSALSS